MKKHLRRDQSLIYAFR